MLKSLALSKQKMAVFEKLLFIKAMKTHIYKDDKSSDRRGITKDCFVFLIGFRN